MAKQRFEDLGFAGKAAEASTRLLNRDGSFNIRRKGLPFSQTFSVYHTLLRMSWRKFYVILIGSYVLINAIFAAVYMMVSVQGFTGIDGHSFAHRYLELFFFSTQTFTTVGYGRVSPVTMAPDAIAAFESMTGLLGFALATGILYGRFSRPFAKILFSRNAVVTTYDDITAFMFRIANERTNQLIDVEAKLVVVKLEDTIDRNGVLSRSRQFYELPLEREKLNFFHLSWTIVHPIDKESPLFGMSKEDIDYSEAEFLILIKAFDDTFSQSVHTRSSYKHHEVAYKRKFQSIIATAPDGITEIYLDQIHELE